MHWVMFVFWLNAQTGNIDHYEKSVVDVSECTKTREGDPVVNGLAIFRVCRQVDADGQPIPEGKLDPTKPEAPKATT